MSLNTINNKVFPVVGIQSEYYLNNASFILHNMATFEKLQSMSHLYFQCHSLSIARTFEKADIRTTQALDSQLRREDHFVKKRSGKHEGQPVLSGSHNLKK